MVSWLAIALAASGGFEAPRPTISARVVRPDRLIDRVDHLFDGASAPNPAAALANWRRATGSNLSKPAEAALALFNPASAREFAAFDDLSLSIGFDRVDGQVRWSAVVPRDDGTIEAALTAMALTGGGAEAPLEDGSAVDRLGMTARPVLASRTDRGLVLANTRDDLAFAIGRAARNPGGPAPIAAGVVVSIDPDGFPASGPIRRIRFGEALRGAGCLALEGSACLEGESVSVVVSGRFSKAIPAGPRIDPAWLEVIPSAEAAAAFALAIDASPTPLRSAFAWLDRVEKADPARSAVAPARVRLNLIASAAGARVESDFWPALRGVSGFVLGGEGEERPSGLIAIQAADEASAHRIESEILPRLARAYLRPRPGDARPEVAEGRRFVGWAAGKPLLTARRRSTVLVAWGPRALDSALGSMDRPDRSASSILRPTEAAPAPRRFGAIWPGRLPGLPPRLAAAFEATEPAIWRGDSEGSETRDQIRWGGLKGGIRKFLDGLPSKPFEGN